MFIWYVRYIFCMKFYKLIIPLKVYNVRDELWTEKRQRKVLIYVQMCPTLQCCFVTWPIVIFRTGYEKATTTLPNWNISREIYHQYGHPNTLQCNTGLSLSTAKGVTKGVFWNCIYIKTSSTMSMFSVFQCIALPFISPWHAC